MPGRSWGWVEVGVQAQDSQALGRPLAPGGADVQPYRERKVCPEGEK